MTKVYEEALRLHALGFAIHWLKPKSKMPVRSGWTSGPRMTRAHLARSYVKGQNVGVRLGSASRFGVGDNETFLAAIDCDVKSKEPKHQKEMQKRLRELFPQLKDSSVSVLSGRGGGSKHIYVRVKTPVKGYRLAQSAEKVEVSMPSTSPSRIELEQLPDEKIKQGLRLRPAWEISFMSDGQQVVLPPSIHPDTRGEYRWGVNIKTAEDLQLIEPPKTKEIERQFVGELETFKPADISVGDLDLPESLVNRIFSGEGVEDRSASLLGVTISLIRAGLDDNEILTILTDRENFLGEVAYEHAKSDRRSRAAYWLQKYTLPKAHQEASIEKLFETAWTEDDEIATTLEDEKDIEAQERDILNLDAPMHWRTEIERAKDGGPPKVSLKNVLLILENGGGRGIFTRNIFANRDHYGTDAPWGAKAGAPITDEDAIDIKVWLSKNYRMEPSVGLVEEAIRHACKRNAYHPVRDYLRGLFWDGEPRVATWLKTYLNADMREPYLSAVSRKVLVAAVARVMQPGCKFDQVLILEGRQGVGKSSAARTLAGDAWFLDSLPDLHDKDARLNLLGHWFIEVSELASLRRSDSELYKAFFAAQSDRVRAPYGKRWEEHLRQCVFIGTTNVGDYLKDQTGNRRFWPVLVGQCDFDGLKRDRDQLFAEAFEIWQAGTEKLYLENGSREKHQAEAIQASRMMDSHESFVREDLEEWLLDNPNFGIERFKIAELFEIGMPLEKLKDDTANRRAVGGALRLLGFKKYEAQGRKFWKRETPEIEAVKNSDFGSPCF